MSFQSEEDTLRRTTSCRRSHTLITLTRGSLLVQLVHVLGLSDPVHVPTQVLLHLLLLPQLLEVSPGLGLLPLLTELSAMFTQRSQWLGGVGPSETRHVSRKRRQTR